MACSKVVLPVIGKMPGLFTAPSTVMRWLVNSLTNTVTCGFCRNPSEYFFAGSASSSGIDLPPAITPPISGSEICPLELTRTSLSRSLTPNTLICSRSCAPMR